MTCQKLIPQPVAMLTRVNNQISPRRTVDSRSRPKRWLYLMVLTVGIGVGALATALVQVKSSHQVLSAVVEQSILPPEAAPASDTQASASGRLSDEQVRAAVVHIVCHDRRGQVSRGSGIVLNDEGLILTNSHVIPQWRDHVETIDGSCTVSFPDPQTGQPRDSFNASVKIVEQLSRWYDLAFLQINDATLTSIPSLANNCVNRTPTLGEPVRLYGYPMTTGNDNLTVTDGIISNFDDSGMILTSAQIDFGNSGGLAVDGNNCLLGVPSAIIMPTGSAQNLGGIIPVSKIFDFASELNNRQKAVKN